MRHIVFDMEFLSLTNDAIIASIGASFFDDNEAEPEFFKNPFYKCLDFETQSNRTIDSSTFKWWLKQSDEARLQIYSDDIDRYHLNSTLFNFNEWLMKNEIANESTCIWSRGSKDFEILEHALEQNSTLPVYKYNQVNDSRAFLKHLEPLLIDFEFINPLNHHSLYDAVYEAQQIHHVLKQLKNVL